MDSKRILIWEVNWLGDVLFSTPFIKAVRNHFKESYIAVIVNPACKEILEGSPYINKIILYNEKGILKGIAEKITLIDKLKKENFDTVFLLHRSLGRALISKVARIKRRIGYFYKKRNFIMTDAIKLPNQPLHKIEYFLNLARHVGAETIDKKLDFFISLEDRDYIDNLLKQAGVNKGDPFIVINPGANWPPKRWPEENYARLSDTLIKIYNIKIVISGARHDLTRALKIQDLAGNKFVILCGKTTLKQAGALFERARVVISGDSGPLHIALAVGSKVIALFGPTSYTLTGPYGEGRYNIIQKDVGCDIPCYELECNDNRCMKAITVEDVVEAVKKMIWTKNL